MKHTIVLSDVHLCEAVGGDGLWMRYRQRPFFPDEDFARLFDLACAEAQTGALELVFNGDLFDFDAPPVEGGEARFDDALRTESMAVVMLGHILDDHAEFVAAVGRVLAAGHRVVFVSGNHDAQLAWPAVRAHLAERLVRAAQEAGASDGAEVNGRVVFRAWFHQTEDGIHIEHGNQYDHYCSYRYPMEPFTRDGQWVQPTMGSLSFKHLVSRMGFFNPHVDSSFMLSGPEYLAHWAKHYFGSPHSLALAWAKGAAHIARDMLQHRDRHDGARVERNVTACAAETGQRREAIERHAGLFAAPSEERPFSIVRELWLDRAALGALGMAAVCTGALGGAWLAAKLAMGAAGAIAAYELALPKPALSDTYEHVAVCQRTIAEIYGARAVVLGHTHVPFGTWEGGRFFGNCGTWSAAYKDIACTMPMDDGRPVIWLRSTDDGERLEGGLYRWRGGMLMAHPQGETLKGVRGLPAPGVGVETV